MKLSFYGKGCQTQKFVGKELSILIASHVAFIANSDLFTFSLHVLKYLFFNTQISVFICSFMGRGVVDAPLDQVASYLHKFQNRLEWDPTIIVSYSLYPYTLRELS